MSWTSKEVVEFHPIVMAWLEQQGYICEHEAYIGPSNITPRDKPDFRAIHFQTALQLIVECKIAQTNVNVHSLMPRIMMQLKGYKWSVKNDPLATVALAIPESEWTVRIVQRCLENNIYLMIIPESFQPAVKPCPKFTDEYLYCELETLVNARIGTKEPA